MSVLGKKRNIVSRGTADKGKCLRRLEDCVGVFKDGCFNPALAVRNNQPAVFYHNEFENDLIISPYVEKKDFSQILLEAEGDKDESERRTQTPQVNLKALFHFPFNGGARAKNVHEEQERFFLRKRRKDEFNLSESKHNFKLYIHRVAIWQKEPPKRKLPMIIQKQLQNNISEEKPKLILSTIPKPSLEAKTNILHWNKSLPPKKIDRPLWNAPARKSKVTSNEIRFQYDKKHRQILEKSMEMVKNAPRTSPPPKARSNHRISAPLKPPKEEAATAVPRPRSIFVAPDYYMVRGR